jgi:hypothetical protein
MAALDPIKKAAVYAMSLADNADDVARVADDWGWKGDPTDRITGGQFMRNLDLVRGRYRGAGNLWENSWDEAFYDMRDQIDDLAERFSKSSDPFYQQIAEYPAEVVNMASIMRDLENADVPVKWTGKVAKAMANWEDLPVFFDTDYAEDAAKFISGAMRPLTNDQRDTFLALLPGWEGSLDDLADAARSL